MRDTKIVATLGPASTSEEVLRDMIRAGVNVVRINFSHGTAQEHIDRVNTVRKIAEEEGIHIGVLADLQGPKSASPNSKTKACFWPTAAPSFLTNRPMFRAMPAASD